MNPLKERILHGNLRGWRLFRSLAAGGGLATLLCACASPWTTEDSLRPTLTALDRDGNGRVEGEELARVRYPAEFILDRDGEGRLTLPELTEGVLATDPLTFDGQDLRSSGTPPSSLSRLNQASRDREDWLLAMREEVAFASPHLPLPSDLEIREAAEEGDPQGLGKRLAGLLVTTPVQSP